MTEAYRFLGQAKSTHEVGYQSKGFLKRNRRYRLYCDTCGETGKWEKSKALVMLEVDMHSMVNDSRSGR